VAGRSARGGAVYRLRLQGEGGGDSAGGVLQQPGRGASFGSAVLAAPFGCLLQVVDDLSQERLDGVQQSVQDGAELGRCLGGCERVLVGTQVGFGERLLRQRVPGEEGLGVGLSRPVQVVRGGVPRVVGVDLFAGAAGVVVQLEVGVQNRLLSGYSEAALGEPVLGGAVCSSVQPKTPRSRSPR
jgi:hypothetical protein